MLSTNVRVVNSYKDRYVSRICRSIAQHHHRHVDMALLGFWCLQSRQTAVVKVQSRIQGIVSFYLWRLYGRIPHDVMPLIPKNKLNQNNQSDREG